jgi:uncharacterized protein
VSKPSPFLTARWLDLALVTYRIPAKLLEATLAGPPEVPGAISLEPDRLPGDPEDVAYASLVAFRFLSTRVKGVAVPLHTDFPEVNLRVYVRTHEATPRRGVVFIREFVPRRAIAMVANVLYHEHYRAVPMQIEAADLDETRRRVECNIELGGRTHRLALVGRLPPVTPAFDSVEHFFKEHTWGFGRTPKGRTLVYRVDHPVWQVYPTAVEDLELDVDFGALYGSPWDLLDGLAPFHVAYAAGSEIAVHPPKRGAEGAALSADVPESEPHG